ncbi:amino acid transporter [Natronospira proteinivora]|uniref:Amino acid transporter n=1 Tax=Natronospira proteinivora TaxID=1807133 RepID=A0ABT1GAN3_9GAMM|nr:hypothetical protein [Natronospira proteinivora]MCP1728383.1 amino acid transporter [Natronospira proteinivora]
MTDNLSTIELVLIGALVIAVLFWFSRGLGNLFQESREAPKDWVGLLLPLAAVVAFVLFMMMMVSR